MKAGAGVEHWVGWSISAQGVFHGFLSTTTTLKAAHAARNVVMVDNTSPPPLHGTTVGHSPTSAEAATAACSRPNSANFRPSRAKATSPRRDFSRRHAHKSCPIGNNREEGRQMVWHTTARYHHAPIHS